MKHQYQLSGNVKIYFDQKRIKKFTQFLWILIYIIERWFFNVIINKMCLYSKQTDKNTINYVLTNILK